MSKLETSGVYYLNLGHEYHEYAVVFAEAPPPDLNLIPLEEIRQHEDLAHRLSIATGMGNLAIQTARGASQALGVVRLAPETVAELKHLTPMRSGGVNLGTLVDPSHRAASSIRWTHCGAAQVGELLGAIGPAGAMLGMQLQLAALSRRLEDNIALTQQVLDELKQKEVRRVREQHKKLVQEILPDAVSAKELHEEDWKRAEGSEDAVIEGLGAFIEHCNKHIASLGEDANANVKYLEQHAARVRQDAVALAMAFETWVAWQLLHLQWLATSAADASHRVRKMRRAQKDYEQHLSAIIEPLEGLESAAHVATLVSPRSALEKATGLVRNLGQRGTKPESPLPSLAEELTKIRQAIAPAFPAEAPDVVVATEADEAAASAEILSWKLREPLLALAQVSLSGPGFLGITPEQLVWSERKDLLGRGRLGTRIPLSDVRYVRRREPAKAGPRLEVITKEEDLYFSFDSWANEAPHTEGTDSLAELLKTAMNLPDSERGHSPLLPTSETATELAAGQPQDAPQLDD